MALVTLPARQQGREAPSIQGVLHRRASYFFSWRRTYGFGWMEAAILALYCGVIGLVMPFHEPWGDEAQAWMLARDNTIWQMVRHRLHYEGAPPLWHILLRLFQLAHGSFAEIGWFGAVFAAAAVYVLLRWSPFPLVVRVLLPFTYFLMYQYAVIARSYVLFALLVFSLCALYGRRQKIVWFAVIAGLLANLSLQGMIVASLICALYLVDLYRGERMQRVPARQLRVAGLVFAACAGLACYTAMPAPDVNFAVAGSVSDGIVHRTLVRFIGETQPLYAKPPMSDPEPEPYFPPDVEPARPGLLTSLAAWGAWQINHRDLDANGYPMPQSALRSAAEFVVSIASQSTWPLATSNLVACVFLGLLFLWLHRRHSLRMLLPWLALMIVGQVIWVADHHVGMLFISVMAAVWIAEERYPGPRSSARLDYSFQLMLVLVLLLQIGWSVVCVRKDLRGAYDPGRETAAYLIQHPTGRTAAFHYWSESIQPYFAKQPFFNMPSRYWLWTWKADPDPYYKDVVAEHPDRIVDSVEVPGPGQMRNQWMPLNHVPTAEEQLYLPWDRSLRYFHDHGYRETHRFCGTRFARLSTSFVDCDLILEPVHDGQ